MEYQSLHKVESSNPQQRERSHTDTTGKANTDNTLVAVKGPKLQND